MTGTSGWAVNGWIRSRRPRPAAALHDHVVREEARTAAVALTATIYNFDIELSDSDRAVYETLALRVARHPSESEEYLLTRFSPTRWNTRRHRVLAGLSEPDEPAVSVRDLTGRIQSWIDIGTPDAARLHKASKAAPRVVVYTHKNPGQWVNSLPAGGSTARMRSSCTPSTALDRALAARLERRLWFGLSMNDGDLYVSIGTDTLTGGVVRHRIG